MREIESFMKEIKEQLENMNGLLKMLIREKMSDKEDKLLREVKKMGRLETKQVMAFLNISRPHAITLMRKVGQKLGFKFVVGDVNQKRPSIIMYSESLILKDQYRKIDELLKAKGSVTFAEIMKELHLDFKQVKQLVPEYVSNRSNCKKYGYSNPKIPSLENKRRAGKKDKTGIV
jgi:hypothetical protein